MFKIQIPKPCHAEWSEMTPTQQGAFCSSCSKEVIDFTKMTDEEVKNYFLKTSTGNTCGRFRTEQVHRIRIQLPNNILVQKIAGWKKFMAVVMLAFGSMLFGCDVDMNQHTQGKTVIEKTPSTNLTGDTVLIDPNPMMLGEIAPETTPKKANCIDSTNYGVMTGAVVAMPVERGEVMGDIESVPDSMVKPPVTDTSKYIKMGEIKLPPVEKKRPVSDTSKCKDPGYY
jgi:hypothetical protein